LEIVAACFCCCWDFSKPARYRSRWLRSNFRHYGKVFIPRKGMEKYEGLKGFEKIAQDLGVSY